MQKRPVIMIVDDESTIINELNSILNEEYQLKQTSNGHDALKTVLEEPKTDLIIINTILPDQTGYWVCKKLKSDPDTAKIPVLFITEDCETQIDPQIFNTGGADFISKPLNTAIVAARVKTHITLKLNSDDLAGKISELDWLANTDPLTDLCNRKYFYDLAQHEVSRFKRDKHPFSLLLIDIDNFKKINDANGHECGDTIIKEISQILKDSLRGTDIIARWSGKEFLCLLAESDIDGAIKIGEVIRSVIETTEIDYENGIVSTTVTIGVSSFDKGDTLDECIRRADAALMQGKENGGNQIAVEE
jgi:diguanylate cyclase (GGDEF)-like protein